MSFGTIVCGPMPHSVELAQPSTSKRFVLAYTVVVHGGLRFAIGLLFIENRRSHHGVFGVGVVERFVRMVGATEQGARESADPHSETIYYTTSTTIRYRYSHARRTRITISV